MIIERLSEDGLERKAWEFKARTGQTFGQLSLPAEIVIRLVSYERSYRDSLRQRKFKIHHRAKFGRRYVGKVEHWDWLDLTGNPYAWETGDCRSCSLVCPAPILPPSIAAEALGLVTVTLEPLPPAKT